MKEKINIFGFDANVEYRIVEKKIEIDKVSVIGIPPIALEGYDMVSHAREYLQGQIDEDDILFSDQGPDPVKPF